MMTGYIGRSLTLMLLMSSIVLISNSGLGVTENPIGYGFWNPTSTPSIYQPDWSALTHVAYPSWDANSEGVLTDPKNVSNYYAVKEVAHKNGVKVIVCVACSNPDTIDSILANHKEEFANNILNVVKETGADGVNLDLEFPTPTNNITKSSNAPLLEAFAKDLYTKMKAEKPNCHISYDVGWGYNGVIFENLSLKSYLDSVFLMGYDYHWSTSGITGSLAPFKDPTSLDVTDSVNNLLNYYPPEQIILGVPFYGYDWAAASDQPGAVTLGNVHTVDISASTNLSKTYGRLWDLNSSTPWYRYQENGVWHQVWCDDEESLKLKYDYIKSENLGGVGFYALGFEDPNIWRVFHNNLEPIPGMVKSWIIMVKSRII